MKRQVGPLLFIFVIIGTFLLAKVQLIPPSIVFHKFLSGLGYSESGHIGYHPQGGSSTIPFIASDTIINGNLYVDGIIDFPGSSAYTPPNNGSFSLALLSERNFSSLTNRPTTVEGYGITDQYVGTPSEHFDTNMTHGCSPSGMASTFDFNIHIATQTTHGYQKIVDFAGIQNDNNSEPFYGNGTNWSLILASYPMMARFQAGIVDYKGKLWMFGGWNFTPENGPTDYVDSWYTTDCINWTCATTTMKGISSQGTPFRMDVFRSGQYYVFQDKVWAVNFEMAGSWHSMYSTDMKTWTTATTTLPFVGEGRYHGSAFCVYDNKMWVIGGTDDTIGEYKNSVWYSSNGINWSCATSSANFTPRSYSSCIVYDNKMWLFGGLTNDATETFAWYSTNGINWTLASSTMPSAFQTSDYMRYAMGCNALNGRIYLYGGCLNPNGMNDVWTTVNGIDWIQATSSIGVNVNKYHHVLAKYNNTLYALNAWFWDCDKRVFRMEK